MDHHHNSPILPFDVANAYQKFWSAPTPRLLKEKIINLQRWNEETPYHLAQIFRGPRIAKYNSPASSDRGRLLEIGCGVGRLLGPLADLGHECHGLDHSEAMLDEALQYLYVSQMRRIRLYLLSVPHYTFPDFGSTRFDVVYSFLCLQHLPTREMFSHYLRSARQVIAPHGLLRLQNLRSPPNPAALTAPTFHGATFATPLEFEQSVNACGWKVIEATSGLGHPDWDWITAEPA